jgi:23S rRNA (guanine745-N1)-methyltransferase
VIVADAVAVGRQMDDTLTVTTVLACPVCEADLSIGETAATCPNAHSFDRARSGYLNLLLSNRKQSAEPGDSPAMLQSRRAFLHGGFYDGMADAANAAVAEVLAGRAGAHVADLGCGEGFFTARLKAALTRQASPPPTCYGVDISRPGIKMAAAQHREIAWIVASLHRSPFRAQSLDVALSMFAPIDAADVRRVVRADGALVTVTPGPDHLDTLRIIIYTSVKPHPQTPALMDGDMLFDHAASTRVTYPIVLESPAQIINLLAMTPYYWHISRATKAYLEGLSRLELTVDACVNVFRPRPVMGCAPPSARADEAPGGSRARPA